MTSDCESVKEKPTMSEDGHNASEPDQITTIQEIKDNVVDWDGPDDPQNPQNWPVWKQTMQVVLASAFLLAA